MYFLPPRLLPITITSITPYANWTDGAMGSGDPWIGYSYQWTVVFSVSAQGHSSQLTQTPFYYTGNDIQVGDWLTDIGSGLAVQIVAITNQSQTSLTAIVEDVDRFNTFTDPTNAGTGIGGLGNGFVFTLNDEGLPIFAAFTPLQTSLFSNYALITDQTARFSYRNYLKTFYLVYQPGQSFMEGDILVLSQETVGNAVSAVYSKVSAGTSAIKAIVGQVSSSGAPGPSYFAYRPAGRVVTTLSPSLPGLPGDLIYLSANGMTNHDNVATHYSNIAPTAWASPMFIQLEVPTSGISLNRGVDTAGSLGYTTQSLVVPDTATADSVLSTLNPGDQVMINDSGYGEWRHTIVSAPGTLRQVATQDSAHVDAESLEVFITANTVTSNVTVANVAMPAVLMGNVSGGRTVTSVNVTVHEVFAANVVMTVGTNAVVDQLITATLIDLTMTGSYAYTPSAYFSGAGYTPIYAFVNFEGTSIGNATITVSYL